MEIESVENKKTREQVQKVLDIFLKFKTEMELMEVIDGLTSLHIRMRAKDLVRMHIVKGFENDLCYALGLQGVEIEAPILGSSLIGVRIPKSEVGALSWKDYVSSKKYKESAGNLMVPLGKDDFGNDLIVDITSLKHALIGGTTGSGKSVFFHGIINSLLIKLSPHNLRFIMIDPKRVELTLYNGIPHLLTPAIVDVKKAVMALRWAVSEMERRRDILEENKLRDIESYRKKAFDEAMPYIIIAIDELSDSMTSYSKEMEPVLVKLAQTGHVVGIHLIVSTSRPSVNIFTSAIRASFPTHIAFQTASPTDSKVILGVAGAEKLLGKGEMIFQSGDMRYPIRGQVGNISEKEIKANLDMIKKSFPDENLGFVESTAPSNVAHREKSSIFSSEYNDEYDDLYDEAKREVVRAGKASTSYLQRKLGIGYARAARLIDMLEEKGVIGPGVGAEPRKVIEEVK